MRSLRTLLAAPLVFIPLALIVVSRALLGLPDFDVALESGEVEGELFAR